MSRVEIRRLEPGDWEGYRSLRLEALHLAPEAFLADLEDEVTRPPEHWRSGLAPDPDRLVLGAFLEGRLVGMGGLRREKPKKIRHKAGIWGVYVSPVARGLGLGRRLMERLIAEAREMEGLLQVTLTVAGPNQTARDLYLSLGFRVYGTEPRAVREGDRFLDDDLMVLFL
ncbi:MAG: GNAT family N-acetyltransferase [Bacillota bacterium]